MSININNHKIFIANTGVYSTHTLSRSFAHPLLVIILFLTTFLWRVISLSRVLFVIKMMTNNSVVISAIHNSQKKKKKKTNYFVQGFAFYECLSAVHTNKRILVSVSIFFIFIRKYWQCVRETNTSTCIGQ